MIPQRVIDRLLANVDVDGSGCRISQYSTGSHGYSQIGWAENGTTTMMLGHRVAWIAEHGEIPDGLTIDHICRARRCVNVNHLRLLTNVDNATDNGQASKTHCPKGHPYEGDNVRKYTNRSTGRTDRRCVTCQNESNARRKKPA